MREKASQPLVLGDTRRGRVGGGGEDSGKGDEGWCVL